MNEQTATGDGGIVGEGTDLQHLKVDIPDEVLQGKIDPDLIGFLRRFASREGWGTSRMLQEMIALWGARRGWRLHWDTSQDPIEYPEEELIVLWNNLKPEERSSIKLYIQQQRDRRELLSKSILDLGLSAKTVGILATLSTIRTVGDLLQFTEGELKKLKGLGRGVTEIKRALNKLGLALNGDESKPKRVKKASKKK